MRSVWLVGMGKHSELPIVGLAEYVSFPEWGIERLKAKIDTGARSSALHVENIQELPRGRVAFEVRLDRADHTRRVRVSTAITRKARVRSSNGQYDERIFVTAAFKMGTIATTIEVSLVDRAKMRYRMLVGRTTLSGRALVDVSRRFILTKTKKTAKRRRKPT